MTSNQIQTGKANKDIFDVTKIILAMAIVAIHTNLFPNVLYPWLRLAVPLFFLMSSFLTFSKLNKVDTSQKWDVVIASCKRLFQLYFFWFVVLFPIIAIKYASWLRHGMLVGLWRIIHETFFSSSFAASWYLVATIQALLLIMFFKWYKNGKYEKHFFVLSMSFYAVCCLRSGYYVFIEKNTIITGIVNVYENIIANPIYSFPIGVFWMQIGRLVAESKFSIRRKVIIPIALVSALCLYLEWLWISNITGEVYHDCLFFLAPLALSLFLLIKDNVLCIPNAKVLRKSSTIIYCTQSSVIFLIRKLFEHYNVIDTPLAEFVVTMSLCSIICYCIFRLENRNGLKILRFSH